MLALCLAALLQMFLVGGAFGGGAEPAPGAVDLQVAVGGRVQEGKFWRKVFWLSEK